MTPTSPPTAPTADAERDHRAVARAWIGALLASLLLWNLPYGAGVLYPFKLLSTWTHELAHAAMMTITGARFLRLEIFPDTSGQAFAASGITGFGGMVIAGAGQGQRGISESEVGQPANRRAAETTLCLLPVERFSGAAAGGVWGSTLARMAWASGSPVAARP